MSVKTTRGVAGQIAATAVTPDGDLTFVGSVYGGPVVMISPSGVQVFVREPERFGVFHEDSSAWVERFLEAS